jgi:L-ribulose-5-phosphate 3-epimerase UlaE
MADNAGTKVTMVAYGTSRASVCGQIHQDSRLGGTDVKRREFIETLGGAATAMIGDFGIRLRQLIGYDRLRSQPA